MKTIIHRIAAGALLLVLPAAQGLAQGTSATAQKRAQMDVKLQGDDKLTCPAILAEAQARQTEFETLLAKADNAKPGMSARTAGLLAAHQVLATAVPLAGGDINPAAGAAIAATANAYMESAHADARKVMKPIEDQQEFAMARGDYLNDLYRTKCAGKGGTAAPAAAVPSAMTASARPTAVAAAAGSGAAPAPDAPTSTQCAALQTELEGLTRKMEAETAEINKMAMASGKASMKGAMASTGTGMLSSVASMALPGIGSLIGSGISSVTQAAQNKQMGSLQNKIMEMSQRQMAAAQRMQDLSAAYQEKCSG